MWAWVFNVALHIGRSLAMWCCLRYFLEAIVVALVMTVAINVYLIVWGTQIWSNLPAACEKV